MPNSNSLRPSPRKVTSIHPNSIRPAVGSPLASLPGNVASGRNAPVVVAKARGANQPGVYGGKR